MTDTTPDTPTVPELIERAKRGKISRRKLLVGLTAAGVTAGGAAVILRSVAQGAHSASTHPHIQLHDQHLTHQVNGNPTGMINDYAEHAMVDDPLFAAPIVGQEAIAQRFAAEVASVPDRTIRVLNRVVTGNTLVVEWEARGTQTGAFFGLGGLGRTYVLRGTTVTTREQGKIVRESHYFDVEDFRRQIS
jgi:steroid delta-isomerase-like uncharacterized protein